MVRLQYIINKIKFSRINFLYPLKWGDAMKHKFIKTCKKILSVCLTVSLLLSAVPAFAADTIRVFVDGEYLQSDVLPYTKNGYTMLPMRAVYESLGAEVVYEKTNKQITAYKDDNIITLFVNQKVAYVNGTATPLKTAPEIKGGRTMVGLRDGATLIGADIEWDPVYKTVNVWTVADSYYEDEYYEEDWYNEDDWYKDDECYEDDAYYEDDWNEDDPCAIEHSRGRLLFIEPKHPHYVYYECYVCYEEFIGHTYELEACTLCNSVKQGYWSDWSDWSTTKVTASDTRKVETREVKVSDIYKLYHYGRYVDTTDTHTSWCYTYLEKYASNVNKEGWTTWRDRVAAYGIQEEWTEWSRTQYAPNGNKTTCNNCGTTAHFGQMYTDANRTTWWREFDVNGDIYYWEEYKTMPAEYETQYRYSDWIE